MSALAAVMVIVAGVILLAQGGGDGNGGGIVAGSSTPTMRPTATAKITPSATAKPTTAPTAVATPAPTASPTPVPVTPKPSTELFIWSTTTAEWQTENLSKSSSSYHEGDVVPFLFRIGGVQTGQSYDISIDLFDCGQSPAKSFDYLTSTANVGDQPLLTSPGPSRARPDAQVPIPDDPDIAKDGGASAYLAAWGGTFQHTPAWEPGSGCTGDEHLTVRVLARASTLYVVWGGHLASAGDWPGAGASQGSSFGISVTLTGVGETRLQILSNSISR